MSTAVDMPIVFVQQPRRSRPCRRRAWRAGRSPGCARTCSRRIANTILTLLSLHLAALRSFRRSSTSWSSTRSGPGTDRDACLAETAGHPVGACWAFIIDKHQLLHLRLLSGRRALARRTSSSRCWRRRRRLAAVARGAAQGPRRALFLRHLPDRRLPACSRARWLGLAPVPTYLWGGVLVTLASSRRSASSLAAASASCWRSGGARSCRSCSLPR